MSTPGIIGEMEEAETQAGKKIVILVAGTEHKSTVVYQNMQTIYHSRLAGRCRHGL